MIESVRSLMIKSESWLLCAIAFFFPMHKALLPYVIALYCLVFVMNGGLLELPKAFKSRYFYITSAYYIFLLMGIAWSQELDAALFDVEVKFSLFLFPLIFSVRQLSSKQIYNIFLFFVLGCLVATLICIVAAYIYYSETYDASAFYYQELSVFQHPSYFSLYLNFCIYLIYYYMVFDREVNVIKSDVIMVLIIVIFSLFVVLLSSKIGLITLFVVIFVGTIMWFLKSRAIFPSIMVFMMLSALIYGSFNYSNYIQGRIQEAVNSISDEKVTFTTTGARIVIWNLGWELFKEKPLFGHGTGDVKHELVKKYEEHSYDHLAELKLNAHNEFLQMLIAIGILGSLLFWLYLYFPLFDGRFYRNTLHLGLLCLVSINFLTESMLETQAGVVFYAFFNAILFYNNEKLKELKLITRS